MSDARIATVGVEEEFHILDLTSRQLVPRATAILGRVADDRFSAELLRSVVESNSRPCIDLADLRDSLLQLRHELVVAAEPLGLGPASAGTVPLVDQDVLGISHDPRYEQMLADYQLLAREQLICGAQVHVEVTDRDLAVAVAAWVAPWLPTLLAVSASSPYWKGVDSGYASVRTLVWQRWPTAGVTGPFGTAAEYDQVVADLIKSGVISDPGMVYFDVRPSAHLPTVELRICDACPDVDTVVLIAGLFRALVRRATLAIESGAPVPPQRTELLRAATWRAARSGIEGDLVDVAGAGPVPARDLLYRLVDGVRDELEHAGDWELIRDLAHQAIGRGSAAARQRRAFARRERLADVADLILAETREVAGTAGPPATTMAPTRRPQPVAGLLAGYQPEGFDEVVDADGAVRAPYRGVIRTLDRLGAGMLAQRADARGAEQVSRGAVFRVAGEDAARPLPFDLVPRIISGAEWSRLRAGLTQRVRALEAFLHDVYGERSVLRDGVVPAWAVQDAPGMRAAGFDVPADAVRASVTGIDLVRDADGSWYVLEDNLRVPSGVAYAMEGRRLTRMILPELALPDGIMGVDGVPALLHETLVAAAPTRAAGEPLVAVLTDGSDNSAHFEHALLAEEMGVALVEPSDLVAEDGPDGIVIHHLGRAGRRRVDVLYRRFDEDDLATAVAADGRPLGPALVAAVRAGTLSLANAPGNGVADDKLLYAYVPQLISYYLGERPLLDDVHTYVCGDPEQCAHVLDHLDELVVKPADGYGGDGVLIGPRAGEAELDAVRRRILADPRRWIGQELVRLSTHPTWHEGRLLPCSVDLRAFVYLGAQAVVAPVALTRVAPAGSMIVNSSRGGGSKDTWLLG